MINDLAITQSKGEIQGVGSGYQYIGEIRANHRLMIAVKYW